MARLRTTCASAVAALLVVLATGRASAQGTDAAQNDALAQQLYDQATTALDAKDYATACPKLEEVVRLAPEGVGAKITLAECYESWGKLASAYAAFVDAAAAAGKITDPAQVKKAQERRKKAQERADALVPRLSNLTVEVPDAVRGLTGLSVQADGKELRADSWNTPRPLDPGTHTIVASAPGKPRFERTLTVDKPGALAVKIEFASPPPAPPPPAPPQKPGLGTRRIVGLGLAAAGGAGLVLGVVGGVQALGAKSGRDGHCVGSVCDAKGVSIVNDGRTWGDVSTVGFIAGGALLATGAVVFLTAPKAPGGTEATLVVSPSYVGVRGAW